jgi:PilZ domain-containing protein
MELSLERVADAVMALRVDLRERPDLERRQLPRFPVWAPTTLHPAGEGWGPGAGATAPFEVWLIDIACGGVGFLSRVPLNLGQEFYITIPAAEGGAIHILSKVVHCRRATNGSFTAGAQFVKEVPQIPGAPHAAAPQAATAR